MPVKASQDGLKVVTGKCRTSFVNLFTARPPRDNPEGAKTFSVQLLIPKSDKATLKALRAAQQLALEEGKSKFGGSIPKNWKDTIHDGDDDDLDAYPEREGHYRVNVSAREAYPPGIVDQGRQPILDQTELYSGCYIRASLVAYAFNSQGSKGVSFGLRNVQKLADGEALSGGANTAETDFDDVDDEDDVL